MVPLHSPRILNIDTVNIEYDQDAHRIFLQYCTSILYIRLILCLRKLPENILNSFARYSNDILTEYPAILRELK